MGLHDCSVVVSTDDLELYILARALWPVACHSLHVQIELAVAIIIGNPPSPVWGYLSV